MTAKRSPLWRKFEAQWLKEQPSCAACGRIKHAVGHHIIPFYVDRSKELDHMNIITLCEGLLLRRNGCHFRIGHLGNWKLYNLRVREDAAVNLRKVNKLI